MAETTRQWRDRKGDRYVALARSMVGNPDCGYNTETYWSGKIHDSHAAALHEGFTELDRSDDFNIGVLRGGELIALLWMDEVVDDDGYLMGEIAKNAGLN